MLARESALDAPELERAKGASESERARQAQMRAAVAGRVEPMLDNAPSVLAEARQREREARMATAKESARVAELEAELATSRANVAARKMRAMTTSLDLPQQRYHPRHHHPRHHHPPHSSRSPRPSGRPRRWPRPPPGRPPRRTTGVIFCIVLRGRLFL